MFFFLLFSLLCSISAICQSSIKNPLDKRSNFGVSSLCSFIVQKAQKIWAHTFNKSKK